VIVIVPAHFENADIFIVVLLPTTYAVSVAVGTIPPVQVPVDKELKVECDPLEFLFVYIVAILHHLQTFYYFVNEINFISQFISFFVKYIWIF